MRVSVFTASVLLAAVCAVGAQQIFEFPESELQALQQSGAFPLKTESARIPIVLFHGIGDACSNPGMSDFGPSIGRLLSGPVYTKCIETGAGGDSFTVVFDKQIETACEAVKADPKLKDGYSIVSLSQGGIVARGLIQRCDGPKVHSYVSFGGPHQGTGNIPQCEKGIVCNFVNSIVRLGVYTKLAQSMIAPANYYKDPKAMASYRKGCKFLPDLNNELDNKNQQYKDRIAALDNLVLVKFEHDTVISPPDTAWFGYFEEGQHDFNKIVAFHDQDTYKEDWIGLKTLDDAKKIQFISQPGNHLQIDHALLVKVAKYLDAPLESDQTVEEPSYWHEAGVFHAPKEWLTETAEEEKEGSDRYPIVLFHGIGDACLNPGMASFGKGIAKYLSGPVYTKCIETAAFLESWHRNFDKQIEIACEKVKADPKLKDGYSIVSLSQGGIVARGLIQRCDGPKVHSYVSFGGPHQGTGNIPQCEKGIICDVINAVVRVGVYTPLAQSMVAPANYYKDPKAMASYRKGCKFLPDLNNELDNKNQQYKDRIAALDNLVLVKFEHDTIISPPDTAWFGFFEEGQHDFNKIVAFHDQDTYKEDWIGLKTLDDAKKIQFISQPGNHLQITQDLVQKVAKYLDNGPADQQ